MKKASVTLVEVAKQAGVSTMTASRAFSGAGYVSDEAKDKVLAAAAKLGYAPHAAARLMKSGRSNVVGIVVNDLSSPVVNHFVAELGAEVRKYQMDLLIYNSFGDLDMVGGQRVNQMLHGLLDGLVYVLPRMTEPYLQELEHNDKPVVLINYCARDTSLPVVRGDNVNGADDAVSHLIELGHRRIAFVRGTAFTGQSAERERGFRQAMERAGIEVDEALVMQGTFSERSGYEAAEALLRLAERPSAIFAANDAMAIGCMNAARAAGLKLPEQLSVVGFDDMAGSSMMQPALTTLRHPVADMARAAIGELMRRIQQQPGRRQRIEFPSEFVIRGSTAPASTTAAPRRSRPRKPGAGAPA